MTNKANFFQGTWSRSLGLQAPGWPEVQSGGVLRGGRAAWWIPAFAQGALGVPWMEVPPQKGILPGKVPSPGGGVSCMPGLLVK